MQYTKFSDFHVCRNLSGQRIDNFFFSRFDNVPRSRIYKAIRCGEFLVNGSKVKPMYKIRNADIIRVPEFTQPLQKQSMHKIDKKILNTVESSIIYEDKGILVLNKISGHPVCGSSNTEGVIGTVRQIRKQDWNPHLIHRLDQGTSGCLLIAKSRAVLLSWQKLFFEGKVKKEYLLVVDGIWKLGKISVKNKLSVTSRSGRKYTQVSPYGKDSETIFSLQKQFKDCALVSAKPITGRTHQIRVHAKHIGHPIIGDTRYQNKKHVLAHQKKVPRMFLHCAKVDRFSASLSPDFSEFIRTLQK